MFKVASFSVLWGDGARKGGPSRRDSRSRIPRDEGFRRISARSPPAMKTCSRGRSGYRLAERYDEKARRAAQRLIQTVFAASFCHNDGACWSLRARASRGYICNGERGSKGRRRTWFALKRMSRSRLPFQTFGRLQMAFADLIERVRQSPEGRELRAAMRVVGKAGDIGPQVAAWRDWSPVLVLGSSD